MDRKLPNGFQAILTRRPAQQRNSCRSTTLLPLWSMTPMLPSPLMRSCLLTRIFGSQLWAPVPSCPGGPRRRLSTYSPMKHAGEELSLLSEEVQRVLAYCRQQKELIARQVRHTRSNKDQYSKGLISLLLQKLGDVESYHSKAETTFAKVDRLLPSSETVPNTCTCREYDSDSSDEDGDDTEDEYDLLWTCICMYVCMYV